MSILKNLWDKKQKKVADNLFRAGLAVEGNFHKMVAIDTGRLDQSIKTANVEYEGGGKFSVLIGSEGVEYAKFVEKASTVKNYHRGKRPKGKDTRKVIYSGEGMNLRQRVAEASKNEVSKIISASFS